MDLYCRPPGQVPVVLNSLISTVSEIYTMISRLMCRSWINVTQGRAVSEAEKGSCLKAIARVPQGSGPVPLSWRLESYRGGKSLRKGRKLQLSSTRSKQARADTGNQRKGLDNIDKEDNTHRQLNQGKRGKKKGLKILIICFLKYLISSASSDSCCCF